MRDILHFTSSPFERDEVICGQRYVGNGPVVLLGANWNRTYVFECTKCHRVRKVTRDMVKRWSRGCGCSQSPRDLRRRSRDGNGRFVAIEPGLARLKTQMLGFKADLDGEYEYSKIQVCYVNGKITIGEPSWPQKTSS